MIAKLKPYATMKDSGVPWIRDVPEHWEVRKLRHLLHPIAVRNRPDLPLLSVVREKGVILRDVTNQGENHNFIPDDLTNYKVVRSGQFAMNKMKAWQGSYGVSSFDGIVSPAYFVFDLSDVQGSYFHTAIRSLAYIPFFTRASDGVRIGQWDLSQPRMREVPFFVAPISEQAAIVRFLDHVDRRIRYYIRAKQKLIKVLEEQKQAVIHRAVTIDFAGRLPVNVLGIPQQVAPKNGWHAVSVGHLCQKRWLTIQDGNHGELHPKSSEFVDQGIPFLMAKDVRPEGLDFKGCAKIPEARARSLRIGFAAPGDVLLTHKATIGQVGLVPEGIEWPFVMLTPQVTYYRPLTHELSRDYLALYFQSRMFQEQLEVLGLNQSTRPYIGLLEQRNLVVCFPPVERQYEIVRQYALEGELLKATIERARCGVSLLREYRTRLIADVVTGKLDVREVATRLPDEVGEPEPLDEAEADTDVDADAIDEVDVVPEEVEV